MGLVVVYDIWFSTFSWRLVDSTHVSCYYLRTHSQESSSVTSASYDSQIYSTDVTEHAGTHQKAQTLAIILSFETCHILDCSMTD